eukprot:GDKH01002149.1.p1 GENE.GDKH01002149.1~~GDKH01002149.1.p1  ORF type:complete len:113 (+),score=2.83 GDKH01002149.1:166-504(+)
MSSPCEPGGRNGRRRPSRVSTVCMFDGLFTVTPATGQLLWKTLADEEEGCVVLGAGGCGPQTAGLTSGFVRAALGGGAQVLRSCVCRCSLGVSYAILTASQACRGAYRCDLF